MAGADEFLNDGRTDESGRSGNENTHHDFSLFVSDHDHFRGTVVS
ncbi:hypothetical protein [Mesorhizobium sp. M0522]